MTQKNLWRKTNGRWEIWRSGGRSYNSVLPEHLNLVIWSTRLDVI